MSPEPPPAAEPGAPIDPRASTPTTRRGWDLLRGHRRRAVLVAGAVCAVLLASFAVARIAGGQSEASLAQWHPPVSPTPTAAADAADVAAPATSPPDDLVSLSATGDIILGDAGSLPPRDGEGFFAAVIDALAADLVMGNLEQPLTEETGYEKCDKDATSCHAFRAPPHYAAHLAAAGFDLMNIANNHGNDFGPAGRENTQAALTAHGIAYTGERDQFTVVEVKGVSVAVVGFSPYAWTNDVNDLDQARAVVTRAAADADLVVVQAHLGAEGADATRVRPGVETFFEERRGDPMAFARAVIDAGADLVIGHGPHVLRGLEFYRGRLIAYSLGNFAGGGGTLNNAGNLGLGAVLTVSLYPDGAFAGGRLISTHMYEAGLPRPDPQQRSLALVRELTELDFPETGARLGPDGEITPP